MKPRTKHEGFVVVVVLCVIILLTVLLLGFNSKSRASLIAADAFRKSEQALNCARAGLNIAIAAVRDTNDICLNGRLSRLLTGENNFAVADGSCTVTIVEQNGKLNVNHLKDANGKLNRTAIDQLLRLIDVLNRHEGGPGHISYALVPAIIDWADADDEVTCLDFVKRENLGAESEYYAQLDPPYRCTNRPVDTIEELLLVKAIEPDVFGRIRDFVTTKSDGKVNINSAPKPVIESLSEKTDPALAQVIVDRRRIKPFGSIAELRDVPGMTDEVYYSIVKTVTVSPSERYYQVTSQGNVNNCSCTIVAVLGRNTKTKSIDVVLYREM